jgi:hypothetical protein
MAKLSELWFFKSSSWLSLKACLAAGCLQTYVTLCQWRPGVLFLELSSGNGATSLVGWNRAWVLNTVFPFLRSTGNTEFSLSHSLFLSTSTPGGSLPLDIVSRSPWVVNFQIFWVTPPQSLLGDIVCRHFLQPKFPATGDWVLCVLKLSLGSGTFLTRQSRDTEYYTFPFPNFH